MLSTVRGVGTELSLGLARSIRGEVHLFESRKGRSRERRFWRVHAGEFGGDCSRQLIDRQAVTPGMAFCRLLVVFRRSAYRLSSLAARHTSQLSFDAGVCSIHDQHNHKVAFSPGSGWSDVCWGRCCSTSSWSGASRSRSSARQSSQWPPNESAEPHREWRQERQAHARTDLASRKPRAAHSEPAEGRHGSSQRSPDQG